MSDLNDTTSIRSFLHDLNNQLGVVMGAFSLIESTWDKDPQKALRMVELGKQSSAKMAQLILAYRDQVIAQE
jgi:hypothetical protein